MTKSFKKGDKISYQYSRTGTYNVSIANNVEAFCFTGSEWNSLKEQLKTIKRLDKNVKRIKAYSFDNCQNLQIVDIGNGQLTKVDSNSFNGCQNLKLVVIPQSLVTSGMDSSAINDCPELNFVSFSGYEKDD